MVAALLAALLAGMFDGGDSPGLRCGVERQDVKTLQDIATARLNAVPALRSISWLARLRAPDWSHHGPRTILERSVVEVQAHLLAFKREADGDIHAVLEQDGWRMVAEAPDLDCIGQSAYREQMATARRFFMALGHAGQRLVWLDPPIPVTVTGPVFFDLLHGQSGAARNGVEIHPVLSIRSR